MPNYLLFAALAALGLIAFIACVDAYRAWKLAWSVMYGERGAVRAHARLDRIQKSANVSTRETKAVSYAQGLNLRDSWADDFDKTIVMETMPDIVRFKHSLRQRLKAWLRKCLT